MAEEKLIYTIEFDTKTGISQIKNLNNEVVATANSAKKLVAEIKNLQGGADGKGGMEGLTAATGGASAAALELGRVISDAPYGIRGMANNVSQLASNILYMSQQTDKATGAAIGFSGAIRGMFAALKGPLGVLLAIQAVIAALDYFLGGTSKANDEAEKFAESGITDMSVKLTLAKKALDGNNLSLEQKIKLVNDVNSELKDLNISLDENEKLTTASSEALDLYIDSLIKTARAEALVELLRDTYKEQERINALGTESLSTFQKVFSFLTTGWGQVDMASLLLADNLGDLEKIAKGFEGRLIEGENPLILYLFGKKNKQTKKIKREFRQLFLDLEKEILSFQERRDAIEARNEEDRLALKHEYEIKELELKKDTFIEKMNQQKKHQDDLLANEKITKEQHARTIAKIDESIALANVEHQRAYKELLVAQDAEFDELRYNLMIEHNSRAEQAVFEHNQALNQLEQEKTLNSLARIDLQRQAEEDNWANEQRIFQERVDAAVRNNEDISIINKEQETAEAQHQAKLVAIDEAAIQARIAALGHYGAAASGLSALLGEQTEAGKLFAVAAATIDTYAAANKALNDESIPSTPARIAAMIGIIATGIANVRNIMQTEVPTKGSGGGGAGGRASGPTFRPDFNIVGASGQNQLAATIAGQVGEPTRAYVVFDDIQTAGEIEANAVTAAGI